MEGHGRAGKGAEVLGGGPSKNFESAMPAAKEGVENRSARFGKA